MRPGKRCAVLLLAAVVLGLVAAGRSFEYDEAYSVFVTSGMPRPVWPERAFRVGEVRGIFRAHAGPLAVAAALRRTDVHPPLYFWALALWRAWVGDGLLVMRLLSVACAVAMLALVGTIAGLADIPAVPAMLLTLGSYGFAYTGAIARGFALAMMFGLVGVLAAMLAERRGRVPPALAAGLAFGAATLTNYLASFIAAAALLWLVCSLWRRPAVWLAAGAAYAATLPLALWFFLDQRDSRNGQFPPFDLPHALALEAKYTAANLFGGLPLYAPASLRVPIAVALSGLAGLLVLAIALRWHRIASPRLRTLLLAATLAQVAGLLVLGALFDSTPIELRYLSFAVPFLGLLLAGALHRWPAGRALGAALAGVQVLSIAGLAFHPATMQPFRRIAAEAWAAAGPDGVILAPLGNDGVGAVGPLLAELPDAARVRLVALGNAEVVVRSLPPSVRIGEARLGVDAASRGTVAALDRALHP